MIDTILISPDKELRAVVRAAAEGTLVHFAIECDSVREGMDTLRKGTIKIVVVDMFLGESSGLDALKLLKKIDETLVLILITRLHGRGTLERAFRYGANDVLVYPTSVEAIRQTLLHRLELVAESNTITFQQT